MVKRYLESSGVAPETYKSLLEYIEEISKRADGSKATNAREMRELVMSHPGYKGDSVVSEEIVYDIVKAWV